MVFDSFMSTTCPFPIVQGPAKKDTIREPTTWHASKSEIPTFKAMPVARFGLSSEGTNHGSTVKSSRIEFKVNSQSYKGSKNLKLNNSDSGWFINLKTYVKKLI